MATRKATVKVRPDEEWRCESDSRTLMEAEKIKADPKRYEKAKAYATKTLMQYAAVATGDKD